MNDVYEKQSGELRDVLGELGVFHDQIAQVVKQLQEAFAAGNKVLVAGNGGSAAEAQHLGEERVGRKKEAPPPYPVVALTADGAVLTCIGNDYGYENVFKRQVEALGKEGDIFVGLSTSGTSRNILAAAAKAR